MKKIVFLAILAVAVSVIPAKANPAFTNFGQSFGASVPEPRTLTLFGAGLIGIAGLIRRKLKK